MNSRYANQLNFRMPWTHNGDFETSLESFIYTIHSKFRHQKTMQSTQSNPELSKEIVDNVPIFEGKASELNQFINTIESFTNLYRILELKIVTLQTRGKPNKIITHAIEDDPKASWPIIKRKLISNYRVTKSRIDTGIQITKMTMKEGETVGEYLARARTLFKAKLKYTSQWNTEYDESDMWYVVH